MGGRPVQNQPQPSLLGVAKAAANKGSGIVTPASTDPLAQTGTPTSVAGSSNTLANGDPCQPATVKVGGANITGTSKQDGGAKLSSTLPNPVSNSTVREVSSQTATRKLANDLNAKYEALKDKEKELSAHKSNLEQIKSNLASKVSEFTEQRNALSVDLDQAQTSKEKEVISETVRKLEAKLAAVNASLQQADAGIERTDRDLGAVREKMDAFAHKALGSVTDTPGMPLEELANKGLAAGFDARNAVKDKVEAEKEKLDSDTLEKFLKDQRNQEKADTKKSRWQTFKSVALGIGKGLGALALVGACAAILVANPLVAAVVIGALACAYVPDGGNSNQARPENTAGQNPFSNPQQALEDRVNQKRDEASTKGIPFNEAKARQEAKDELSNVSKQCWIHFLAEDIITGTDKEYEEARALLKDRLGEKYLGVLDGLRKDERNDVGITIAETIIAEKVFGHIDPKKPQADT